MFLTGAVGLIDLYLTQENASRQLRQTWERTQEPLQLTEQVHIHGAFHVGHRTVRSDRRIKSEEVGDTLWWYLHPRNDRLGVS